jgi:HlyD family secretion protein
MVQVDQDLRTEVGKELAEVRSKISELAERKIAAEDQLNHIDIRTPQSGTILQLAVHNVGGVIAPVMMIVPDDDTLTLEVRVLPLDIDQVNLGQRAKLRFSSFNQRTTPEIFGEVSLISADLTQDQRTGTSYYSVRISPLPSELARCWPRA